VKLVFLLLLSLSVGAQDVKKNPPAKKAAKQLAHKKATPEQVRRFNQLQEKQKK
jgi:hypothetical protein